MPAHHTRDNNAAVGGQPDLAITDHGSDWYWTVCALMALSTFILMGLSYTKRQAHRLFHYTTAGITLVAAIAYYSMASRLGQTAVQVEYPRPGQTQVEAAGTRQIFWVRYVDYAITWPLILTNLFLTSAVPRPTMLATLLAVELMVVGYLAGALTPTSYKWGYFAFGLLAYFFVVYSLLLDGRRYAGALGGAINRTFRSCAGLIIVVWSLYPIAWGLSEGGNVIHPDSEAIFYGILDIFSKIVVGFLLVLGHRKIDPADLGLHIREYSALPRHEKHGAQSDRRDHRIDHRDHRKGVTDRRNGAMDGRRNDDRRNDVADDHDRATGHPTGISNYPVNRATEHNNGISNSRDNRTTEQHNGVSNYHDDRATEHRNGMSNYHDRAADHHRRGAKRHGGGIMSLFRMGNRHRDTDHEYRERDHSPARGGYHDPRARSPVRGEHQRGWRNRSKDDYDARDRSPIRGEYRARQSSPARGGYRTDDYPPRPGGGDGRRSLAEGEYRGDARRSYPQADQHGDDRRSFPGGDYHRDGRRSIPGGEHHGDGRRPVPSGEYHQQDGRRSYPSRAEHHGDDRRPLPGGENHGDGRRSLPGGENHGDGRRSLPGGEYHKDEHRYFPGSEYQTEEPRSIPGAESHRPNIQSVSGAGEYPAEDRRPISGTGTHRPAGRPALGIESHGDNYHAISGDEHRPDNRQSAGEYWPDNRRPSGEYRPDNRRPSGEFHEPQGANTTSSKPVPPVPSVPRVGPEHTQA